MVTRKKENKLKNESSVLYNVITLTFLILYTLIILIIFYLTISTSLKTLPDYKDNPIGFPKKLYFENYSKAFQFFTVDVLQGAYTVKLIEMFLYSFLYAIGCSVFATAVPCIVAYCCAKYKVWLNKFLYGSVIVAMILPIVGALPSQIRIMKALGLYNHIWGTWIMHGGYFGMYFLVFYSIFQSLSNDYKEAAIMDGASEFHVFFKIVIPLVSSTIFAVIILNFIGYWNDYQSPMIFIKDWPTAAVGLFDFIYNPNSNSVSTTTMQMAGCMLLFVPMLILFIAFKNIFMGNLTVGGLKE